MIIANGEAVVVVRPMGMGGLEGYELDDKVNYQLSEDDKGKRYYKIWKPEWEKDSYSETCSERIFTMHFDVVKRNPYIGVVVQGGIISDVILNDNLKILETQLKELYPIDSFDPGEDDMRIFSHENEELVTIYHEEEVTAHWLKISEAL